MVAPYDAEDARGLLKAAVRDPDPVRCAGGRAGRGASAALLAGPCSSRERRSPAAACPASRVWCTNCWQSTRTRITRPTAPPPRPRRPQVVVLENEILYGEAFPIAEAALSPDFTVPIGKAKVGAALQPRRAAPGGGWLSGKGEGGA